MLLEFLLYAVLVQCDHVPPDFNADVCALSRELYTWSAFNSVRRAALRVWAHFDPGYHLAFSALFDHDPEHRRYSWCVMCDTREGGRGMWVTSCVTQGCAVCDA